MRLGDRSRAERGRHPHRLPVPGRGAGHRRPAQGRIVEIYGPESSGKTTLALHVVAEAQKRGGEVAFVDAEHALDPTYARALGVNIDDMLISQPDTGEQALEITEALVRSGAIDVMVVDSVAALVPRAEIEGEMGDSYVGLQARLMSQALRKLTGAIGKTNTIVIFINQLREKVGVMYGNPEVTTGGRALKFYASVRIDVRRIEALKNGGEVVGNRTRAKVVKNKVAPPSGRRSSTSCTARASPTPGELMDLGVKLDIVQKSGSWFSMGETRIGQGRDAAKKYLQENPEMADRCWRREIRANFDKLMSNQSRIAAPRPPAGRWTSPPTISTMRIDRIQASKHKRGRVLVFLAGRRLPEGDGAGAAGPLVCAPAMSWTRKP
ncbi:MAG: recombinase RecA [Dysosmobacter sp.]